MNAPANIPATATRLPAAWERYLPTVAALCPAATGEEAELRARLMLLIDLVAVEMDGCTWESGQALVAISAVASAHKFTPMNAEMLGALRIALLKFYRAAHDLENLFGDHGGG